MGLNRPIPVALQVADYLAANTEASFEKDGAPIDTRSDYPRVALHSVMLKMIHNLGTSLKAIVE
eukprot:13610914-Alexandrium_andersonii.AAC.1